MRYEGDMPDRPPAWISALADALAHPRPIRPRRRDVRARLLSEWVTLELREGHGRNGRNEYVVEVRDRLPKWASDELDRLSVPKFMRHEHSVGRMTDRVRSPLRASSAATAGRVVGNVYEGEVGDWKTRVRYLGCGPPGSLAGCACTGECYRIESVAFRVRTDEDRERLARVNKLVSVFLAEVWPAWAIVDFKPGVDPVLINAALAGAEPPPPPTPREP